MTTPKADSITLTILFAIACSACAPGGIAMDGETGTEEDPTFCIDPSSTSVSCWVPWNGTFAEVWPECLIEEAAEARLFDPVQTIDVPGWGWLDCYDVAGTDTTVCFVQPWGVLVTWDGDVWSPSLNDLAGDLPTVDEPC